MTFPKKKLSGAPICLTPQPRSAPKECRSGHARRVEPPPRFAVRRASSSPRPSQVFPVFLGGGASRHALAFKPRLPAFPREGASLLMTGMRQDTMKHMDMDKSLSNKERFDKLKESRQKYKDEAARQREEARSANQKVEALEKQLRMLVARVEAGEEAKAKADGTPHADRLDALNTKVSVLTAELERQKAAAARATNAMHAKTMEASEWRKKCEKMTAAGDGSGAGGSERVGSGSGGGSTGAPGGLGASGDYYAAYVYGALLGASAVAIIGYGALSYSMRAAR